MAKISKPDNEDEVLKVMQDYCIKKKFNISFSQLQYLASDCYLYFESRGWAGVKYWPAVAMRWVLNNTKDKKFTSAKEVFKKYIPNSLKESKGKTVRDTILEQDKEDGI